MANYERNPDFKDGNVLYAEGLHHLEKYLEKCLDIVDQGESIAGDLNLRTEPGVYMIASSNAKKLVNAPATNLNGCKLIVLNHYTNTRKIQLLFEAGTSAIYWRIYEPKSATKDPFWSSWKIIPRNLSDLGVTVSKEILNKLGESGFTPSDLNESISNIVNGATPVGVANRVANALIFSGTKISYDGSSEIEITAKDLGLDNAIKFIGVIDAEDDLPTSANNGDVILWKEKEYIYSNGEWVLFGDEGSYALKSITIGTPPGSGLTGGGNLTQSRALRHAKSEYSSFQLGPGKVVTGIEIDSFGHLNGYSTNEGDIRERGLSIKATGKNPKLSLDAGKGKAANTISFVGHGFTKVSADNSQISISTNIKATGANDADQVATKENPLSISTSEDPEKGELTIYFHRLKGEKGDKGDPGDPLSGIVPIANGGTGATTVNAAQTALLGNLEDTSDTLVTDKSLLVFARTSPDDTRGAVLKKRASAIWTYIQDKANSVYASSSKAATDTTLGLVKIGYKPSVNDKNYPVQLNSNGQMYVNVPWTDNNTSYDIVTKSTNGLVPAFDAADGIIDSDSNDWVLTNNSGSIGWYKLPANAFNNTTYSDATQSKPGLMSIEDKKKLDGIAPNANNYSLPIASSSTLGGVKTGSSVTSPSGLTACPIINGIVYYKDTNTQTITSVNGKTGEVSLTYSDVKAASASHNHDSAYYGASVSRGANTVLAGPNGSSGNATFRKLVAADIPNLSASKITSDTLPIARGGTGATTAAEALTKLGLTATATELNYCDGATSNIQTQLNGKASTSAATQSAAGLMSVADKKKLDNIAPNANNYTLPTADSSTLGGVKIGSNINVSSGTISITKANVTAALGYDIVYTGPNDAAPSGAAGKIWLKGTGTYA